MKIARSLGAKARDWTFAWKPSHNGSSIGGQFFKSTCIFSNVYSIGIGHFPTSIGIDGIASIDDFGSKYRILLYQKINNY